MCVCVRERERVCACESDQKIAFLPLVAPVVIASIASGEGEGGRGVWGGRER